MCLRAYCALQSAKTNFHETQPATNDAPPEVSAAEPGETRAPSGWNYLLLCKFVPSNSKDQDLAYLLNLMHNTCAISFWHLGEKEGSRRRLSWTEGWEEDRKARFGILQAAASEAEEP